MADIAAISAIAKRAGVLLAVDNTFMSSYFQRPLELGADMAVNRWVAGCDRALTKFAGLTVSVFVCMCVRGEQRHQVCERTQRRGDGLRRTQRPKAAGASAVRPER